MRLNFKTSGLYRNRHLFIFTAVFLVAVGLCVATEYGHEENITATVLSINTRLEINSGTDGMTNGTTTYLVGTDKGVFKIQPDGLMASPAFGAIEVGKTYSMHMRGFSFPFVGVFPYIIDVEEMK